MKHIQLIVLACMASSAWAGEGVDAILARRKTMKRVERPVAQRMEKGVLLSVYGDGSAATQAVSLVTMRESAKARVDAMRSDAALLASARNLAGRIKKEHGKAAEGLADAQLVDAAEQVFDSTGRDASAGLAIGLLFGAAAAKAAGKGKGKGKNNNKEEV